MEFDYLVRATNDMFAILAHRMEPTASELSEFFAMARYVPNRQFLSIPFRSELIHCPA
jgi:hypothetical protein